MPPKKHGVTWSASPHTIAKIEIVRRYLDAWFPIIGLSGKPFGSKPLLYLDGFAGPGEYRGGKDGSPIVAVRSAIGALERLGTKWSAGSIYMVFVERDAERFEHLSGRLETLPQHPKLRRQVIRGEFANLLPEIQKEFPHSFSDGYPLFAFVDPFGIKGVPFSVTESILSSNTSELLLNFNADAVARNMTAGNEGILTRIFGDDRWRERVAVAPTHSERSRLALLHYLEGVRELGVKYTIPFGMHGNDRLLDYYLLFASRHPTGFDKMAEVMRRISGGGQFRFSDATHKNLPLDFGPSEAAERLLEILRGQKGVALDEIDELFRLETLFPTVASVLKFLQDAEAISVNWKDPQSPGRKGTFSRERVKSIDFR